MVRNVMKLETDPANKKMKRRKGRNRRVGRRRNRGRRKKSWKRRRISVLGRRDSY